MNDPHLDVVFVHGLGGSGAETWVNAQTQFNWTSEMNNRSNLRAVSVDYFAPNRNAADAGAVQASWQDSGLGLLSSLANKDIGKRPIVFVAHSLGGIVVKQALRLAADSRNAIYENTRGVIFLATPHAGATIATIATHLGQLVPALGNGVAKLAGAAGSGAIVAWGLSWIAGRQLEASQLTQQLRKFEPALLDLNRWYRNVRHIETRAYYETELTYQLQIVDPVSADPGVIGCAVESAQGKNHITICKPENDQDELFRSIARIIENIRSRVREGTDDPIMRDAITQILTRSKLAEYRDIRNFEDVPNDRPDDRRDVELALRNGFRKLFQEDPLSLQKQQQLEDSNFNIDSFALSLWLQEEVDLKIRDLITHMRLARLKFERRPFTLIPLFRAARTLDHVLGERDYEMFRSVLNETLEKVNDAQKKDSSLDESGETRKLLNKLVSLAEGFAKVKSEVLRPTR
jgi:pimeloyl-ACP methyl ester carboxylesterase